jgi:hypothetical protein
MALLWWCVFRARGCGNNENVDLVWFSPQFLDTKVAGHRKFVFRTCVYIECYSVFLLISSMMPLYGQVSPVT